MSAIKYLILLGALFLFPADSIAVTLCPDGSYVDRGPCKLCPDGSYIGGGGSCNLTPSGSYTRQNDNYNNSPRLAPSGKYIEGGRGMTMCPDGNYVAGSRCRLAPNGQYIGVD